MSELEKIPVIIQASDLNPKDPARILLHGNSLHNHPAAVIEEDREDIKTSLPAAHLANFCLVLPDSC